MSVPAGASGSVLAAEGAPADPQPLSAAQASRLAATVLNPTRGRLPAGEGVLQLLGGGDRRPAGEVLADVGGGAPVDRLAALEQRDGAVAARQHQVGPVGAAHH